MRHFAELGLKWLKGTSATLWAATLKDANAKGAVRVLQDGLVAWEGYRTLGRGSVGP